MWHFRILAVLLATLCSGIPALASTVIPTLHRDQLLGETSSRVEIQHRVAANEGRLAMAGSEMGLTPREFAEFLRTFKQTKPAWVTLPRHLDAMSAIHRNGNVYIVRDVVIPAGSSGWEVDLHEPHQLVRLFMPASCGNLSVIRTPIVVHLAKRPPLPPRHIETAAASPPPPTPAPVAAEAFPPPPHHNAGIFALLGGIIWLLIGSPGPGPGPGPGPVPNPPPPCPPVDAVQSADCGGSPPQ